MMNRSVGRKQAVKDPAVALPGKGTKTRKGEIRNVSFAAREEEAELAKFAGTISIDPKGGFSGGVKDALRVVRDFKQQLPPDTPDATVLIMLRQRLFSQPAALDSLPAVVEALTAALGPVFETALKRALAGVALVPQEVPADAAPPPFAAIKGMGFGDDD